VRQAGDELEVLTEDPRVHAKQFSIVGEIALLDLDLAGENNKQLILDMIRAGASFRLDGINDASTALSWLNQGVAKVFARGDLATPDQLSNLPKDRVIVALAAAEGVEDRIAVLKQYVSGFLLEFTDEINIEAVKKLVAAVGKEARLSVSGKATVDEAIQIDKLGADVQIGAPLFTGEFDLGAAITGTLVSDRADGLFATVVTDEQGVALGLVYSSAESVKESIRLQRGVYYSRSRKSIWYKGETSGDTQTLVRIEVDCDKDALKFVVGQEGDGFCHLKSRSCFARNDVGLGALMRTLEARKSNAPAGSYTKRLFEDENLLRAKLVEEANELADAKTKDHICLETADVIYFALVAAAKAGVTLADIERELDLRSLKVQRRPGNAKPHIVNQLQQQDQQKQEKANGHHSG
jgi:phosphoribosyl-ATP pyrophosphohydrolase